MPIDGKGKDLAKQKNCISSLQGIVLRICVSDFQYAYEKIVMAFRGIIIVKKKSANNQQGILTNKNTYEILAGIFRDQPKRDKAKNYLIDWDECRLPVLNNAAATCTTNINIRYNLKK